MALPRHLFTPAFRHQHLGRSFAAIVGIVVFIASFATAAEAVLLTAGYLWGRTTENSLTVEIPAVDDEASMPQSERIKQTKAVLEALPGVRSITQLAEGDVEKLLEPWFKDKELLNALPLPALIDVEKEKGAALNEASITAALKDIVADARVDDHQGWARDVWRLIHGLALLGGLTIALTAATLVLCVSLICRAVIAAERETIALLHFMGAENADIAHHFQHQAFQISSRAAALGFVVAGIVITGFLLFSRRFADLSSLEWTHWTWVVISATLVPFCATGIATATARISVMRLIRAFP